jgi:hypothetical protein
MPSRKSLVIGAFAVMAVGYLVLPTYMGLSENATDLLAAALLPLALCILTYEDHRHDRSLAQILGVLVPVFLLMFLVGAGVLLSGVRLGVLIPINALIGGVLYWFIGKHILSGPH